MVKWLLIITGSFFLFAGMMTFWLPLPIGLPLMMIGLPLLLKNSPKARAILLEQTTQYPRIHALIQRLGTKKSR